jgi:uncharacterized protein YutE (UPF0331/DUF86 family)
MSPQRLRESVVTGKVEMVERMLAQIRALPLDSEDAFLDTPLAPAAAESFLRRALEALLDLGRHLLAKGFGVVAAESKAIPAELREAGVLDGDLAERFVRMAGYRNRLTHFYDEVNDEVTPGELYRILTRDPRDVTGVLAAMTGWIGEHPDRVDRSL